MRRRTQLVTAVLVTALAGCGGVSPSDCLRPGSDPVTLSSEHRRNPTVATGRTGQAIVAWESTTGEPVEVRTRAPGGDWTPVRPIGDERSRDPAVAIGPDGRSWIAIAGYADDERAVIVASGPLWDPEIISRDRTGARKPQIGVIGDGTVLAAWITDGDGTHSAIATSIRTETGWSPPGIVASPGTRADDLTMSVATDGSAVLAWTAGRGRRGVFATARGPRGAWGPPVQLSAAGAEAIEPATAAARRTGWVAWAEGGAGPPAARVRVAQVRDGAWRPAVTLDGGSEGPRQMSRPGQSPLGPQLAAAGDGSLVAAWAIGDGPVSQVRARRATRLGAWGDVVQLSDPANQAGAPAIGLGSSGPVVGWEEIDGGLLRARTRSMAGDGACVDLSAAVTETASVALGSGSTPIAVFVDLRRGRVQERPLR